MPTPLSIQLYTVRDVTKTPEDFNRVLKQIADIGYVGIESGVPGHFSPADFKKFLDDLGLKVSGTWDWPDESNIGQVVEHAKLFGYTFVTNGFGPGDFQSPELIQKSAQKAQTAAELCTKHGLTFCLHNHAWEFEIESMGKIAYHTLMELAPAASAELDVYWASAFGKMNVPLVVKKYAGRIPQLHVKDGPLIKNEPNTACGHGKMDLKACVHSADPEKLKWLVVELDQYVRGHEHVMEAVQDSYTWLTESGLGTGTK